ncbi:MAG TPA: RNA-binding protein [Halanaerobiaceae bacterium]|jgi:ribosomal protein L14E/L6E/L27E|nr:KOW domain-containing RNA-binding protein [Bacillota bacterium]HHU92625.1 RNA-binding protein [Halanaerobiaceae bacterium]HQD03518.1 KOW domain-containing RNA-binding protein [Halanaerobiales bacterium]
MVYPYSLGEIVISKAGRDAGKHYIIVGLEKENYVKIANGDTRRIENPKRKNVKHLYFTGDVIEELAIWLENKKRIRNEDLKRFIKDYEKNEEA